MSYLADCLLDCFGGKFLGRFFVYVGSEFLFLIVHYISNNVLVCSSNRPNFFNHTYAVKCWN